MQLKRLFELQDLLNSFQKIDNRSDLLKEEKELLSIFDKVAPRFNDLIFKKLDKFDGLCAVLELQKNVIIKVFLCNSFMSNGINTYEVSINKNGILRNFEYQTKEEIEDILSYQLQYIQKK